MKISWSGKFVFIWEKIAGRIFADWEEIIIFSGKNFGKFKFKGKKKLLLWEGRNRFFFWVKIILCHNNIVI